MSSQFFLALLLSFLPVSELRGGMIVMFDYVFSNGLNIWPYFFLVVFMNILAIFAAYFFLDFLHEHFLKIRFYRRFIDFYIERIRKKGDKIERRMSFIGYFALMLFVAVPFTGTGAWTGTLIAWLFGFDKKKSILAISAGIVLAGLITLSVLFGFSYLFL